MKVKIALKIIVLLLTTTLWSQNNLGIGIVAINFDNNTIVNLYSNINDKEPIKTIHFFDDKTINSWNIRNLEKNKKWLKPESLWLDYSYFIFRCVTKKDKWFKVIVNNENGSTLWIKKSNITTFKNWETYLKGMFGISRLINEKQKIRISPNDSSKVINYQGGDCFQVKSMRGDWIEIFTADYCDDSYTTSKIKIKSGWIRWKQGSKLLIEYFLTS